MQQLLLESFFTVRQFCFEQCTEKIAETCMFHRKSNDKICVAADKRSIVATCVCDDGFTLHPRLEGAICIELCLCRASVLSTEMKKIEH